MEISSLGYRMEFAFPGYEGEVTDRGDYTVISTSANPTFCGGNHLLLEKPPKFSDLYRWRTIFAEEFSHDPKIEHEFFAWDRCDLQLEDNNLFLDAGYAETPSIVMKASEILKPEHLNPSITTRPVTEEEWDAAAHCAATVKHPAHQNQRVLRLMTQWHLAVNKKQAAWYGAFLNDHIVGGFGTYEFESSTVIELVGTHPESRKQGVCRTMIYQIAHKIASEGRRLMIAADPEDNAYHIYKQLGFVPIEHQSGLARA